MSDKQDGYLHYANTITKQFLTDIHRKKKVKER